MAKRIARPEDLPDWFDTRKYSEAIRLDARGWLEQLVVRRFCYDMYWYCDDPVYLQESDLYGFPPNDFLCAVRETPIFPFTGSRFDILIKENLGDNEKSKYGTTKTRPGIHHLTPFDIASCMHEMKPERQQEFLKWLDIGRISFSSKRNRKQSPPEYPKWFFEPISLGYHVPVVLDVGIPNKILDHSFDLFVSEQRKNLQDFLVQKDQRANTFLEWCNCGLLQYIDLAIWGMLEDIEITNKALALGIFPGKPEKGEENIRSTTKKHALDVLEDGIGGAVFMARLRSYAAHEDFLENTSSE